MNSYELSRKFCDWAFENPDKIRPIHYAIYFFSIEHCNRLGWKDKFGLPSQMVMEAIGVKNWRTYSSGLKDLVDYGFIEMIEISKNQYSSNIIAIVKNTKASTKALDKALQKHSTKQSQSTVSIDKQLNKETIEQKNTIEFYFELFWEAYDRKVGRKDSFNLFKKIDSSLYDTIIDKAKEYKESTPDIKFRKYPKTWLNGKCWEDEILILNKDTKHEQLREITARAREIYPNI